MSSKNSQLQTNQKPWPPAGVDWYYSDDYTAIAHGDCLEILPYLPKVDLVLTDPPYGIGEAAKNHESRSNLCAAGGYGRGDWDNEPIPQTRWNVIARDYSDRAIIWGGNHYDTMASTCWLVWDKDNTGDFADCELAWTNLPCAVRMKKHRWNGMLQEPGQERNRRQHPTQKPLQHR